jgi:hypothetical protein
MKRICIATLFCCLLGFLLATTTIPSQLDLKPEVPAKSVVNTLRLLNTPEYSYHEEARQLATIPSQVDPPTEISAESLVNTLRFLNTHEYWYHEEAATSLLERTSWPSSERKSFSTNLPSTSNIRECWSWQSPPA